MTKWLINTLMHNKDKVFNSTKSFRGLNSYIVFVWLVLLINFVIDRSKSSNEK